MRNKYLLSALILGAGVTIAAFIVVSGAAAQTTPSAGGGIANIQYPVAELGNCANETACRSYCDDAAHVDACLAFAQKHQLMSSDEIQTAKKFGALGKGPGGCTTKESCNQYCDSITHIDECVAFGEKNGLMSSSDLQEAKKVQAAIAKGVKPPACGGKQACDQYCSDPSYMEECVTFGQAAGLMSPQEAQDSAKVLAAIKSGAKPPACRGKTECDQYCSDPAHMEECMTFAQAAGFMSPQEAQNSTKILAAIKKGAKPPACQGKEACDKYCGDPAHADECIAFSEAAGLMTPQEAAVARKTGGKGPGGCTSKESCDAFCNDPANQETCFNFGKDNGLIPPDQLQQMEEGKKRFAETLNQAPAEVVSCISNAVGSGNLEKFKSGAAMPSRDIGDKMGACFGQMMGQQGQRGPGGPGVGGNMPPGQQGPGGQQGFGGPQGQGQPGQGGQFQPGPGMTNPGGQMMPPQAGPGGCKTPEECQSYCTSNPEACQNFKPANGQGGPGEGPQGMMPGGGQRGPGGGQGGQQGQGGQGQEGNQGGYKGISPPPGQPGGQPGQGQGGGMPPPGGGQPGSGGPGPQQFQQQMQQFQGGPSGPPPGGGAGGPPPSGGGSGGPPPGGGGGGAPPPGGSGGGGTPPPPSGGFLLDTFHFFFGQ